MVSEDGRFVIVFNGEIFNYPSLRRELEGRGAVFRTVSDTEVLLHLFAREGAALVRRLRGMFAFAIWDTLQGRLFLARDAYGIKPLYTSDDGKTFRFGSQVKALLAGGGVSSEIDAAGWVGFHLFGSVPEPFSLYRDIRALPAGHMQWVDGSAAHSPQAFTSISAVLARQANSPAPVTELNERTRSGVLDSVRAHLLADVEVGVFLSAGVDSGSVLGLMKDAGQHQVRALTLAFDEFAGSPEDEAPLAAKVAAQYGAAHIVRRVSRSEFERELPLILQAMDQPSIDGINTWFVAKAAKEQGLKVALSGLGGDELFAGYPSFVDVPRWRRRYGLLARVPGLGRLVRRATAALAPGFARTHPKALGMLEFASSRAGAYLLRRGLYLPHELAQLMDPDWAAEGLRRLQPLQQIEKSLFPDPGSEIGRIAVLEATQYMRNQLLRDADWAGMAHGVEIRVPLVDTQLLETIAPVLPNIMPGIGKMALAQAPRSALPDEIVNRPKTGFVVPTGAWLKSRQRGEPGAALPSKGRSARLWSQELLADMGDFRSRMRVVALQ